jgi:hypothetical protein
MTLKDQMQGDITRVFLNTNEFADSATFTPKNPSAAGFACIVQIGDPAPQMVQIATGVEDRRPAEALASRTALRAGILASISVARDPMRGDFLTVPSGAYVGVWEVSTVHSDQGDGMVLALVWSKHYAPGGQGARATG